MSTQAQQFTQGIGQWAGTAEVYDGRGRFLGNGSDNRQVQRLDEAHIRIDVSFVGPFKHAGHYFIAEQGSSRLYQGPANVGYAETLHPNLIDATAYWPALGLSQQFFLLVLPNGHTQLSLAFMSRGEKLIYVVVGQNDRVKAKTEEEGQKTEGNAVIPVSFLSGTSYDLADDPAAGRGRILLHRSGLWSGELTTLDGQLRPLPPSQYSEQVAAAGSELRVEIAGTAFAAAPQTTHLHTNQWEAWSDAGNLVGSYSLSGGRALSGHFHFLPDQMRLWRREVVSHDGHRKAVLHTWYRGRTRIGVQFGVLEFAE
ncbi:MAG: hypothetical protein KJ063_19640 [Anaerolineae bacterium]|nr:hypothetical protein [Anaerolineae bacterium]